MKNLSQIRVGQELEVLLIDRLTGRISPSADLILNDSDIKDKNGNDLAFYEGLEEQLELISNPASSISGLEEDMAYRIAKVQEIADKYNLLLTPSSIVGPNDVTISGREKAQGRTRTYRELFQDEYTLSRFSKMCGLHTHVSCVPGRESEQYNLMLALDPVFAFAATTTIDDEGQNTLNCSRVNRFRHAIANDPKTGKSIMDALLPDYISDISELHERDVRRREYLMEMLRENGGDVQNFEKYFGLDNTGYHPIRHRPNLKPNGTFEARAPDSTTLDIQLGIAALYLGANRYLASGVAVNIANQDGVYSFGKDGVVLPTVQTLRDLEFEAVHYGVASENINKYLSSIVRFAEFGLDESDIKYLNPLKEMLASRRNISNDVMDYVKSMDDFAMPVSRDLGAKVHLYLASRFQESYQKAA